MKNITNLTSTLKKVLFPVVLTFSMTALAYNPNTISLGEPGYGGNGCPSGSASATLSPDGKSLSILFDSFSAEAGGDTHRSIDRKSCNIAIPVHVPNGLSISVVQVDYRGFNGLPAGATSRFNVEYFFAGAEGPKYQKNFRGPLSDEYLIDNKLALGALVWSPCGADVNLRVNASMMAINTSRFDNAIATVDSADFKAGIIYRFAFQACH